MKLKITYILILLLIPALTMMGNNRKKEFTKTAVSMTEQISDFVIDTMTVNKKGSINDYSLIGIQYGAGLSQVMWNPTQKQEMLLMPYNIGVTYTRYGKMFGYMPFFGFQVGVFYGQEGYKFKKANDSDYIYTIQGADKAVMNVIEVPFVSHMHIDFWKMKVLAEIGMYVGYRLNIRRYPYNGAYTNEDFAATQNIFLETDRRWDYGIKGGLGFGFVFDPIEVHLKATYKHAFSSLYEPDHHSQYYYRYAYPSNIVISAGVHFQLTKRTGKTKTQLKKEAKELVYGIQ